MLEFLFWLSVLVPGFVMVQTWFKNYLNRGVLGVLARDILGLRPAPERRHSGGLVHLSAVGCRGSSD